MKIPLVPWWLLLFGSLTSGHYIRQAEDSHSNVYEVREGSSGVSFVNPKPEKPTLREILYYHVIERARDGKPVTERSFTNGHGYQFLESESSEHDLSKEKQHDDGEYEGHNENLSENEEPNGNQELNVNGEHSEDDGHYEPEHGEDDGHYEPERDENEEHNENKEHDDKHSYDEAEAILRELLAGYNGSEEDPESTTTQKPLTDEDVKEAYKTRSYLFDQTRQRYAVKRMAVPATLNRRKRQASMEPIPDAPEVTSDISLKEAYMQPKTYGMNLNPEGGYVWNNLNKPTTYYELGNGNPNEGEPSSNQENIPQPAAPEYSPAQSQEYIPPPIENAYVPIAPETSESGSSEDIYISTNRPSEIPVEEPNSEAINENPEPINENPEPINEYPQPINPEANFPVAPVIAADEPNDKPDSDEGPVNFPMGPEVYNPEPSYPEKPALENPGPIQSDTDKPDETEQPQGIPISEGPAAPVEANENPGSGYESSQPEEPKVEAEEGSEGETIKEMPEAPTLPPLNYDNLPSYIRDAISSTEKPASYEPTENPYINPQPNPEDKKVMEDKMEDIFATATPVEDIPKTYGMNLTSDGGHVWNDMMNPPVSYDVGSTDKSEEDKKEQLTKEPEIIEPETNKGEESKIPDEEPEKVEKEEPTSNPDEPNPEQPEPHESEEAKNPEPEKGEIEEPVNKPEPETPEKEDKPVEEPVEPEPENPEEEDHPEIEEPENPEIIEEPSEENEQEEPAELKPEDEKKPDIMSELLKSEQFWKWLGEWTATYMELLEKHIRKIAIQEICNRQKEGAQMCFLDESPEDTDTGVIIKDGKITVDGKEIDLTHTDNLDNLKKGHNHNNNNDKDKGNKIEASTIYGNSVGNEHVTNVFIFTGDKADVDKLKPSNDSEVDFVIDDRIKEENVEKEASAEKEAIDSDASKDELNKEVNKDPGNKEESKGNSDDLVVKDEVTKEDETKPEFSETSNASKEYLEK